MEFQISPVIIPADELDIRNTFDCGQCFRWNENPDGSYSGVVQGRAARIYTNGDEIYLSCSDDTDEKLWHDYFDLGSDYAAIRREITELCPALSCALGSISGIRILSQEPWEALCSFIISQNNNIPRIKGIVERLCEGFGAECDGVYSFPSAECIAALSADDLAPLRAGFRTRYILDAAGKVASGEIDLEALRTAPLEDCRRELMKICGVGIKVAECTMLYGLHRLDAFPVDVWMKKALSQTFSGVEPDKLGRYAGVAQQYIFHYSRMNPELFS